MAQRQPTLGPIEKLAKRFNGVKRTYAGLQTGHDCKKTVLQNLLQEGFLVPCADKG